MNNINVLFYKYQFFAYSPLCDRCQFGDGHDNLLDYNRLVINYYNPNTFYDLNNIVSNFGTAFYDH